MEIACLGRSPILWSGKLRLAEPPPRKGAFQCAGNSMGRQAPACRKRAANPSATPRKAGAFLSIGRRIGMRLYFSR